MALFDTVFLDGKDLIGEEKDVSGGRKKDD